MVQGWFKIPSRSNFASILGCKIGPDLVMGTKGSSLCIKLKNTKQKGKKRVERTSLSFYLGDYSGR